MSSKDHHHDTKSGPRRITKISRSEGIRNNRRVTGAVDYWLRTNYHDSINAMLDGDMDTAREAIFDLVDRGLLEILIVDLSDGRRAVSIERPGMPVGDLP